MTGWSNTSSTARRSALAPSSTARTGRVVSRPAVAEVDDQVGDEGGVLRGSFDQAEGMLGPVDPDAEGDDAQVPGEVDAVDHQRHQIEARQVRGQQLGERRLGRGHEPARHRRLRRRRRLRLDRRRRPVPGRPGSGGSTAWPASAPSPSAPAAPSRRTARRSAPPARRAVGGADPGPAHRHPAPAEGHRPRPRCRGAPPSAAGRGGPSGRTAPATSSSIIAVMTCEPGRHRQGQQALLGSAGEIGHRHRHPLRQHGRIARRSSVW